MADQTVVARLKRQRELRAAEGWREVKVWVPTGQDAEDIRKLAEERRAKAEALHGLSKEVPTVTPELEDRIAKAITEHGSAAYTTPTGAVLDLMTHLAEENDLLGFSRAVIILARAKPANAHFVTEAVPRKITNFLISHRRVDPSRLVNWTTQNRGWADSLKSAVREPERFAQVVEAMADSINEPED